MDISQNPQNPKKRLNQAKTSTPNPVYVFDLDGVITDAKNSQVDTAVVERMYELLARGVYVAVNTGRSYEWVEQALVRRLQAHNNSDIFKRFITVCEKGGETVSWHKGVASLQTSEFALSHEAYAITQAVFDENQAVLQSMFWDASKRTMATVEKVPSANLEVFHEQEQVLVALLTKALTDHDARIDKTNIAVDVESPAAGKYAGGQLVYNWVYAVEPNLAASFVSIGDSISDYEMARYFAEQGAASTFVYVGVPTNNIKHHDDVDFVVTTNQFAQGALEYLNAAITE